MTTVYPLSEEEETLLPQQVFPEETIWNGLEEWLDFPAEVSR
jgi:hypothetical protein